VPAAVIPQTLSPDWIVVLKNDRDTFGLSGIKGRPNAVVVTSGPPTRTITWPAFSRDISCGMLLGGTSCVAAVPTVTRVLKIVTVSPQI
jgi:hypothetical protein